MKCRFILKICHVRVHISVVLGNCNPLLTFFRIFLFYSARVLVGNPKILLLDEATRYA
jgi:hypothetical protein